METFKKVLGVLVTTSIPILISGLAILFLLSPLFMNVEYRRPNFPLDTYGFTTEDRLEYGNLTRRYLITKMPLDDLRDLSFDTGEPLYIERELSHLEDVKVVLLGVQRVFYVAIAVFSLGGYIASSGDWKKEFLTAISHGGKITAGLLVIMLVFTLLSFQSLFTNFHLIFFEGDSWLFLYSDTLIRLFPVRFWEDIFLVFGVFTLLGGIFLGWVLPILNRNKDVSDHSD